MLISFCVNRIGFWDWMKQFFNQRLFGRLNRQYWGKSLTKQETLKKSIKTGRLLTPPGELASLFLLF